MTEIDITQKEADELIAMKKYRVDETIHIFPPNAGDNINVPLSSLDKREEFTLDLSRGRIDLAKVTYQNRARKAIVLVRLDLHGPPHRNPNGEDIPCPHIHRYKEGYGDKWADIISSDKFANTLDPWETLIDFMNYCNIIKQPDFQRGV